MKSTQTILGLGALAALMAAGFAFAQPPRALPPVDQFGPVVGPLGPLQMPADPGPNWSLDERGRLFELQTEGILTASGTDQVRVQREGEPDAILFLRPETSFFLEGRSVTRDLLPLGAEVRAVFDLEGNRRVARRIEVLPAGESAADEDALLAPDLTAPPPVTSEIPGSAFETPPDISAE